MKNKKYLIIGGIILLILIIAAVLIIPSLTETKKESDAVRFSKEYTMVGEDNVFVYRNSDDVISMLKHGTGVVYIGFPECPWCQTYVKYLNEVAKEVGVTKIYYYNILEDRTNNTAVYKEIVEALKEHLEFDDEGKPRVYVPNVSFHVAGKIIGNDLETAYDTKGFKTPEEYWTEKEVNDLKKRLKGYMEEVYNSSNSCTTCNK